MSAQMPSPGDVFQSRYRMERLLGQGGFALVYLARDIELGREVAIKVLRPQNDGHDDRNAVRFMREAKLVARLNHPHIVMMFDYGTTDDGLLFAVFELVAGQDLTKLMTGPMPQDIVVTIVAQVLDALAAAHDAGLLHRDVKPDNIRVFPYMEEAHRVKLLDFGIARPTKDDAGLTASGMVVGTPRFMAPEVLYEEPLGPHSDIYSLGLVMYEMVVGARSEHLQRLIHKQPVRLPPHARVSLPVRRVIDRMLEREVPPRYASAAAVRTDLLNALRESRIGPSEPPMLDVPIEPLEAFEAHPPVPARRQAGQTPLVVGGLVALLLTLVAVAMLVGLSPESQPPPAVEQPTPQETKPEIRVEPLPTSAVTITPADAGGETQFAEQFSRGCGKTTDFHGSRVITQPQGLEVVEWLMHVPDDYDPDKAHPLLILLHDDSGTSARAMLDTTRFDVTADAHDFLIAAPDDSDIAYPWTDEEDLAFVERVMDATRSMFCVDNRRIFLFGHGGGGWGVETLSCRGWVAGVAFSAFLLEKPAFSCDPARPVPTLSILPMDSRFLPPGGGPDCIGNSKLGFDQFEELWGDRNSCGSGRQPFGKKRGGECSAWSCETPFVACRVDGGRRWPDEPVRTIDFLGCDGPNNTFPFNETIWSFFSSIEPG